MVSSGLPIVLVSRPLPLEPAARLQFAGAERVHEYQDAELFGLGPDRVEFRVGQLLPGDAAADRQAAQPQSFDRVLELLDRQLRVLQCDGRKSDEAVRGGGAELGQLLVLDPDQLGRGVAVGAIPEGVDAERLDIDPLGIHLGDAVGKVRPQEARRLQRMVDHRRRLRNDGMGVDVDSLDPLAIDHDLAPPPRLRCPSLGLALRGIRRARIRQAAADKGDAGERAGQKFWADSHVPGVP